MNNFTKIAVAFAGLALSMSACAPAVKGNGAKIENIRLKQAKAEKAMRAKVTANAAVIKSVEKGESSDDGIKYTIVIDKSDLKEADQSQVVTLKADESISMAKADGAEASYLVEAKLSKDGKLVAVQLTQQIKAETAEQEDIMVKSSVVANGETGEITERHDPELVKTEVVEK